jgi:hypothetical protein
LLLAIAYPRLFIYPSPLHGYLWFPKKAMNRSSSLLLIMALLFAQAALLEHEYDFAAHKSGDTCVTCLHATPLSHAMTGAFALAVPVVAVRTEFYSRDLVAPTVDGVVYRARAPPFSSFV